jgi:adenosine deaminase
VTLTIGTNVRLTGLPWQAILDGLNAGRTRARHEFGLDWHWVFDISRDNPETQKQVVEIALAARDRGVVALGLGGSEAQFPPELFESSFCLARRSGLARVPHAGETAGPKSIWSALLRLHADRLGHGVRSIEDPALMAYLRENQVPLELCPTSNICLGVYPDYGSHPLRRLWDEGLMITVNSDDPPLFGVDLNAEYRALVDHFGFGANDLQKVSLNGLCASFLPQADKSRMESEFHSEFARLGNQLEL